MRLVTLLAALAGCDAYAHWPDPHTVFPWVHEPEVLLEHEAVRVETETWTPLVDPVETGLYVRKSFEHLTGAPTDTLLHFAESRAATPSRVGSGLRIDMVGDIMDLDEGEGAFASGTVRHLSGHLRLGNLETPTSPDHPSEAGALGTYAFNAHPKLLDRLPLDVLQFANNHALDAGNDGLEATLAELDLRNLVVSGVDAPPVVDVAGERVAVLAYTWGLNRPDEPTTHDLHVVPFGHLDERVDLSVVEEEVAVVREAGATIIVVMVHWGFEYEYYPHPRFMILGRRLVSLGADLVVGSGSHVAQPFEPCYVNDPAVVPGRGVCSVRDETGRRRIAAIFYSLGNFGTQMATVPAQTGLVAHATVLGGLGVTSLGWEAVVSVDTEDGTRLVPLDDLLDEEEYAEESARLDALVGQRTRVHTDVEDETER